jgi:hypothetical protein
MSLYFITKTTKSLAASLALIGAAILAMPAQATDLWCNTKIGAYGIDNGSSLWINMDASNGGKWTAVCNLAVTTNNSVTPQACQGMMSTILTAKALGRGVSLHLMGPGTYATCSQMPNAWNAAISSVWTASD